MFALKVKKNCAKWMKLFLQACGRSVAGKFEPVFNNGISTFWKQLGSHICTTKLVKFARSVIRDDLNCFGATFSQHQQVICYMKLTVLFPRLWTRQLRYAVLPTRAVTFLEAEGSKYGPRRPVDVGIPRSSSSPPMILRPWYASSGRIESGKNHKQSYE